MLHGARQRHKKFALLAVTATVSFAKDASTRGAITVHSEDRADVSLSVLALHKIIQGPCATSEQFASVEDFPLLLSLVFFVFSRRLSLREWDD